MGILIDRLTPGIASRDVKIFEDFSDSCPPHLSFAFHRPALDFVLAKGDSNGLRLTTKKRAILLNNMALGHKNFVRALDFVKSLWGNLSNVADVDDSHPSA
jgi:hypothetical protein